MIGKEIDHGDEHWRNFLLHLKIVDYVFAPVVTQTMAAYLRELIQDHHIAFKSLYTGPIIPKMHYMVHYPEWMARLVLLTLSELI